MIPRIRTHSYVKLMRGGEMRGSVTPTASKLEGGAKRAHKTVFFDIRRVYMRGQVCVCNFSLAYKSASFRYFEFR